MRRAQGPNMLASICEDMCEKVGAYLKCNQCPAFVPTDATPGVTTWVERLTHLDNWSNWGPADYMQSRNDEIAK